MRRRSSVSRGDCAPGRMSASAWRSARVPRPLRAFDGAGEVCCRRERRQRRSRREPPLGGQVVPRGHERVAAEQHPRFRRATGREMAPGREGADHPQPRVHAAIRVIRCRSPDDVVVTHRHPSADREHVQRLDRRVPLRKGDAPEPGSGQMAEPVLRAERHRQRRASIEQIIGCLGDVDPVVRVAEVAPAQPPAPDARRARLVGGERAPAEPFVERRRQRRRAGHAPSVTPSDRAARDLSTPRARTHDSTAPGREEVLLCVLGAGRRRGPRGGQRFSSSSATRKASSRLCMWFRRGSHRLS